MRFLITGITGFAGTHLAALLLAEGHEVFGTTQHGLQASAQRARDVAADHVAVLDVGDRPALERLLRHVCPDGVFHLAALTSVPASFTDPEATYRTNLFGSLNVFAAVRDAAPSCRIVWVGSSDAYGLVNAEELPVVETQPFRPLSPYAASKAAADLAAWQWSRSAGLAIVRVRPFNHTGPGQAPHFVCSAFARQVIAVQRGRQPPRIAVGNLDTVRDFSDVRDVVRAYLLAWERGQAGGAYNVCSGVGRTPQEILDTLLRLSGVKADIVLQSERQRAVDVPILIGSAAKLHAATGWSPTRSLEQTLRDLLDDWLQQPEAALG